jgi:hypothetical protein
MLGLSVTFFPKHKFTNYSKYNKTTYINKKAKKRKLSSIIEVPDRQDINVKNIKIKETVIVPSVILVQSEPINHIYLSEIKNIQKENDTLQKENDTLQKENDTLRNMINIYQTNYIHQ